MNDDAVTHEYQKNLVSNVEIGVSLKWNGLKTYCICEVRKCICSINDARRQTL